MDELRHARALSDELGEIFCLTFVKDVDEVEALRRIGAFPDTVEERSFDDLTALMESFEAGLPTMAAALSLGPWSMVIEPSGFHGADTGLLATVSRGTEAVSVLRHDYASHQFAYAVDGTVVTSFDPGWPGRSRRWGSDPERLAAAMHRTGLLTPAGDSGTGGDGEDDYGYLSDGVPKAILLAQDVTGCRVPPGIMASARLSAHLEPWFVTPASRGDLLRADEREPYTAELADAARTAPPPVQRAVAVAEIRRQAAALGVAGTPGLEEALTAAARTAPVPVPVDSPLGRAVRGWLADQKRAHASLNVPHQGRLSADQRRRAFALGWFTAALRGALDRAAEVAVLAALRPLTSGIPELGDRTVRKALIQALARDSPR